MKYRKLKSEIKGVFKLPRRVYYFGKLRHGVPYFYPWNFHPRIMGIRKLKLRSKEDIENRKKELKESNWLKETNIYSNYPMVRRTKNWIVKLFGNHYYINIGWPMLIKGTRLGWKDKFESPRFEWAPSFHILFFGLQFCIHWVAPDFDDDKYYEMVLWYLKYSDKDIKKAEETWGWTDFDTKESTWNEDYILWKKM